MLELAAHILDIAENSVRAGAHSWRLLSWRMKKIIYSPSKLVMTAAE